MTILDSAVLSVLPLVPRPIMRRLAARYIAGEDLQDALRELRALAARDLSGILNLLGEHVHSEREAADVVRQFVDAATAIGSERLPATISVKPTHVGLEISETLALASYRELAAACREAGVFLRVEMEDHSTTDATLRIFEALRADFANVGVVLQARLLRTPKDIAALAPGPLDVRMVKGIYIEPAAIAHTEPQPIRDAFVACTAALFERRARVALATHDEAMAAELLELVRHRQLGHEAYEFQVLMGVQEPLWQRWHDAGHTVRVYVPYGPSWRDYSLRRMRKNPAILRHVMRNALPW